MVKAPAATIANLTCLHCGHVGIYALNVSVNLRVGMTVQ
jgi:hypothetical protein